MMNTKIKVIAFVLAAMMVLSSVAFAATGTVTGGSLRLRKKTSTSSTTLGWFWDGETVTINGAAGTNWYAVSGYVHQHSNRDGWYREKSGYCMSAFIE